MLANERVAFTTASFREGSVLSVRPGHPVPLGVSPSRPMRFFYAEGRPQGRNGLFEAVSDRRFTLHKRRSEEHTSELRSLMRISYAVFCLNKTNHPYTDTKPHTDLQ